MRLLSPGTLIDRYELVSPIGEGGMAQVWVARQKGKHGFEKLFAFKCIHHRFAEVPSFRSMFLDEARIAAAIEHPNVAQVFDLGEAQSMLYLVIEYVDGESLGALMTAASRRAGQAVTVPVAVALRIIADACAGLHAAHRLKDSSGNLLGVVHRDVSPQNILVSVRGDVKVIDFGIAHARDRIGGDTGEGSLKGKIHYMAPEQALREELGPATDVFGIGATLYRMLGGVPPFDGGNDAATLHMLLSKKPAPLLPDSVPPLVAAIVERALSYEAGDRYVSAAEMQTALEQAIVEEGYVPDVATWVHENISDNAQARRAALGTRTMNIRPSEILEVGVPTFDAELGLSPKKPPPPVPGPPVRNEPPAPLELASLAPAPPPAASGQPVEKPRSMMDVYALVARSSQAPRADYDHDGRSDSRPELRARISAPPTAPELHEPELLSEPSFEPFSSTAPDSSPPEPLQGPRPAVHARDPMITSGSAREAHATRPAAVQAREVEYVGPATGARPPIVVARTVKVAVAVSAVVVVLVGFLLLLPRIVRDRIIAGAKEAGVELTVEKVGLGFGNASLHGVTAKPSRVPGAVLRADEVFILGFSAKEVRIRGGDLSLDGTAGDVAPALLALYDENRVRIAGTAAEPRKITLVSAHVTWTGVLGDGSKLEATELATELESHGLGQDDVRASVGSFTIKTKRTTFGPWGGTFDRIAASEGSARVRLLLDPPVPDGPSALVVWTKTAAPRLTATIARSQISHLGVRLEDFGFADSGAAELALKAEGGLGPTMHNEFSGKLDLYGIKLKALKTPVDISVSGNLYGTAGKPLELQKTTLVIGPIVANVLGTVAPTDFGFRLDASWRTLPVPCEKLARADAKLISPTAAVISDMLRTAGIARVTGNANASGIVRYDTKAPDEANTSILTHDTCGLSIFGL